MNHRIHRRQFVGVTAAGATLALSGRGQAASYQTTLSKALIGKPTRETLVAWKAAGYQGIESNAWNIAPDEAAKAKHVADGLGMQIHCVLFGWANFNVPASVEGDIANVDRALKATQAYGADAMLLVPCRVGGKDLAMPQPWEFSIEFDKKTGHLKKVVDGDNRPYLEYIKAHDHATDSSRAAVEKLIPVAEKTGVIIALENVWNNLWVQPAIFKHFVASFDSPWVQAYFDIGNHVKYAPPEQWIGQLGKLIVRCHVKDFQLKPDGRGGQFCNIRDGSVDWPRVRKQLDAIGYNGWMTIEGSGRLSLEERNRRLDRIIAGQ